jgi:hypothetical protein
MEEKLNEDVNRSQLSPADLVTDLMRILYARHPKASESDCLLSQCQTLMVKVKNGDEIHEDGDKSSDLWTIATSGNEISQQCDDLQCPDFEEFRHFFAAIKPFLVQNDGDDDDEDEATQYHNFILDQFTIKDEKQNRSVTKAEWRKRAKTTAMPSGDVICNLKTLVSCHKLVGDFRFLIDFKVNA